MLDDTSDSNGGDGGWSDDDLPWTRETFKIGDRVTWTEKALRYNVPTRTRRHIQGNVTAFDVGASGATHTVTVLWDGYKRPHSYAGSFITKVK